MKKLRLVAISVGIVVILIFTAPSFPTRFRLNSTSPSGKIRTTGLRFQGKETHLLDGTLRLFVSHNDTEVRQQTSIPWDRDLKINWKTNNNTETFVIEKDGTAIIEFQIMGSELKCLCGEKYLAEDPYK